MAAGAGELAEVALVEGQDGVDVGGRAQAAMTAS